MELRHLRYFTAVAGTLNYRAAAVRLALSAPALSKQIRDLEAELGVKLFDRDTSRVRLTNAGSVFLAEARQILAHVDDAVMKAREADKGRRGRLVVGNVGALTAGYIGDCVTAYCARHPEIALELVDTDAATQLEALERGSIDLGFVPAGMLLQLRADLRHCPLVSTPLFLVLPAAHRLARRASVALAELSAETLLCIDINSPRLSHRRFVLELFARRGIKAPHPRDVKGLESVLTMVASGQGISILAGKTAALRVEGVVARPLRERGPDLKLELHAVWRTAAEAVAAGFIEEFRRVAGGRRALRRKP